MKLEEFIEIYLDSYDVSEKSIEDIVADFNRIYSYKISRKDFIQIAEALGYKKKQVMIDGKRFYSLR